MSESQDEPLEIRLEKLNRLRVRGVDPYPHSYHRTHTSRDAFSLFESEETDDGAFRTEPISIAGRMVAIRSMGKATFIDLLDRYGRFQTLFRGNTLPNSYEILKDLDIGDWIGVSGPLFRTRAGEVTVEVHDWTLLSKSLRSLPEKWHGLADVEIRYRQRYLDLIANSESRAVAVLRSRFVKALRHFMEDRGFMEVETPVLVPVAAGAMAKPFVTHHNTLNRDLYLRIATELNLKKLIVGGLEKVYEIGRVFRNEGVDFYHNPEFTMMESYEAFVDYNDVMEMVEKLIHSIALEVLDSSTIKFDEYSIDLTPPWSRISLRDEIKKRSGIDFLECTDIDSLREDMSVAGFDVGQQVSWGGLMDKLVSSAVEPHLLQPTFLMDYPVEMSPLAKKHRSEPRLVERFEGFIAGMEICNAFTELNDPVDQRRRFEEQETLHIQFQDEDMDRLDEDFLIAVEHGMPPTGGLGLGIDRLVMLLSGQKSIREVVLFPQLRSR